MHSKTGLLRTSKASWHLLLLFPSFFLFFFGRLCVDKLIINNRTESALGCHILFSDTKTDLFSRNAAHRDRDDALRFGEELLCFHEWMLLRSEEVKERRETLYWCEKVLRNPPSTSQNTLFGDK